MHCATYIASNPVDVHDVVGWLDRFRTTVSKRKGGGLQRNCSSCANGKPPWGLIVLGIALACVLVLVVIRLVKLTKARLTK